MFKDALSETSPTTPRTPGSLIRALVTRAAIAGLDLLYLAVLALLSPTILWIAARHGKYREGWAEKFLGRVPSRDGSNPCIWFHAVSVGEVTLLRTIIPQVQSRLPGWAIVVSTTTKTGRELLDRQHPDLLTFYCPLDFSWATSAAMRRVRPTALVLAELELWPNLIRTASEHGAKVMVVNGRLSQKSFDGYRRIRWFVSRLLGRVSAIAVQDEQYAARFMTLGAAAETTLVTGSIKFDGAESDRSNQLTERLARLWEIHEGDAVLVAGSTQAPEEQLAVEAFLRIKTQHPQARLILVPRHPQRFEEVARSLDTVGVDWCRRTEISEQEPRRSDVLLVDTIGELRGWWGTALSGFVGGSLGSRGGQNMIEPAAYGVAVCFGPQTQNFRDVVQMLLKADAAEVVQDGEHLQEFWQKCLDSPNFAVGLGRRAQQVVVTQQGATERTVRLLVELVGEPDSVSEAA